MGVRKEIILIIVIIVATCVLEIITSNISQNSINKVSKELGEIVCNLENSIVLRNNGNLSEENKSDIESKIKNFKEEWIKEQNKLSLFVEHDELEKVTESLILLEEYSKNEEYEEALTNSARFEYWLYHFEEKEKLKIKNIF